MSVTKTTTIWCDGVDGVNECGEWVEGSGSATSIRAKLRKRGWVTYVGGKDMCPDCVKEVGAR